MTSDEGPRYRIGEVALRAGVTTRTLRYYQEFGLLDPSGQSPGGSRRYSEVDVARLFRIIELRNVMGLDLERIRAILQAEDRLAQLRAEARRLISDQRRREIVAEAIELNAQMRAQVREKLVVLEAFLAGLETAAAHCQKVARELDMGPLGHRRSAVEESGDALTAGSATVDADAGERPAMRGTLEGAAAAAP